MSQNREKMIFDVVIVGGGPAGLACAIRLKQLNAELKVCLVEKGAEIGAHLVSGAVLEPRALTELLPNWQQDGAPVKVAVTEDQFWFMTSGTAYKLPTPASLKNTGNYIISLSQLARGMAQTVLVASITANSRPMPMNWATSKPSSTTSFSLKCL